MRSVSTKSLILIMLSVLAGLLRHYFRHIYSRRKRENPSRSQYPWWGAYDTMQSFLLSTSHCYCRCEPFSFCHREHLKGARQSEYPPEVASADFVRLAITKEERPGKDKEEVSLRAPERCVAIPFSSGEIASADRISLAMTREEET